MEQEELKIIKKLKILKRGLQFEQLPNHPEYDKSVPHAPIRIPKLTKQEEILAISNALRYFNPKFHNILAKEFQEELQTYGHIYMYRFRPTEYVIKAYPIDYYPCKIVKAKAIQLMIMNNLSNECAQFPHELIIYGGNGSIFQNWAQFLLTMKYLCEISEQQTLVMNSGHPQGLFPSQINNPKLVISNGMMIPNYSTCDMYEKLYALGNTMYGQMTAGSYCYIGSQGIVHGTTINLLNQCRKILHKNSMKGIVFVSSGLGGMSGAQPKAGDICECISVIAEVNEQALDKRLKQGWVKEKISDIEFLISRIKELKKLQQSSSLAYLGNIVTLWERIAQEEEQLVNLGSDQTSCHNPFGGGYYPVQLSFQEANEIMNKDNIKFQELVRESLRRQIKAINYLADNKNLKFFDYGNSFLLQCYKANANVLDKGSQNNNDISQQKFRYPTYFESIMDDIFGLGFGPFRWVCTSGEPSDLLKTDELAAEVLQSLINEKDEFSQCHYEDNLTWIKKANQNQLVVGSQARILYSDAQGRINIALKFNDAIRRNFIKGPIVISRDHHDVSGTDSPFRETSNIQDGSKWTADMAIQNVIGDSFRGADWVAIHNGGGVGWGEVINGGFGMILDGSNQTDLKIREMLSWDVNNGLARRAWSGSKQAQHSIKLQMQTDKNLKVTLANDVDIKNILN